MSDFEIPSSPRALSDDRLRAARLEQAKKTPAVLELNRLIWRISNWERKRDRLPYLDPTDTDFAKGKTYFRSFMELIHRPRTVLVMGSKVRDGWEKHSFEEVSPGMNVVFGPSPSPPGIDRPGNRERLRAELVKAFAS